MSAKRKNKLTAAAQLRLQILFSLGAGLLLCLLSNVLSRWTALFFCAAAMLLLLLRARAISERFSWLFLAAALYAAVNGVSTLYAVSPKFALLEFTKILIGFAVFVAVSAFSETERTHAGRAAALLLSGAGAVFSLVSIDLLSTRILSGAVSSLLYAFGTNYLDVTGLENGIRMTSILGNGNIFAGCVGICVLLSLGLAVTAEEKGEKRLALCFLALNALGFVLAFSMGATAMFLLAALAMLLLEQSSRRAELLVLMLETFLLTLFATFPIYLTAFDGWHGVQPIPLLCSALSAAALCVLDEKVGRKCAAAYREKQKGIFLPLGILLAVFAAFVVLSTNLTGAAALQSGDVLRRSAYPAPGDYTLSVEADQPFRVCITSQNRIDTMMHTRTVLYEGNASGASFAVPDDSLVVYFDLSAEQDAILSSVSYQGEESGSLKLHYSLLPGFIANRLQGLRANQNAIQRVVFFEDGLKIFRKSPIIGRGLGAFENGIVGVQDFYYATKYAHNHYIQTLSDTGVIGFICFVSMLTAAAWAVLKSRKNAEAAHPMTTALGAVLVFMAGHAAVEVVFSNAVYLFLAFGSLGLINLTCGNALPAFPVPQKGKCWGLRGMSLLLAAYCVLIVCSIYGDQLEAGNNFSSYERAAAIDRFDRADYESSYVYSAYLSDTDDAHILAQAEKYLQHLLTLDSNSIPLTLAECYFHVGKIEDGFAMLQKYTSYVAANSAAWQSAYDLVAKYDNGDAAYDEGLSALVQAMKDWDDTHIGTLTAKP